MNEPTKKEFINIHKNEPAFIKNAADSNLAFRFYITSFGYKATRELADEIKQRASDSRRLDDRKKEFINIHKNKKEFKSITNNIAMQHYISSFQNAPKATRELADEFMKLRGNL
jgi:hypothetical protein